VQLGHLTRRSPVSNAEDNPQAKAFVGSRASSHISKLRFEILRERAADMTGCLSYVVAKDATDENTIWVTEVWDSMASHDASLSSPGAKNAIPRDKAIVSNFEKIAVTRPVWGAGLPAAHAH
jgi:quinol monooxygenase YgiN